MPPHDRIGAFFAVDLIRIMHNQPVGAAFVETPNGDVCFIVTAPIRDGAPRRLEVFAPTSPPGRPALTVALNGRGGRVAWRRILRLLAGADSDAIEAMGRFVEVVNTLDAVPATRLADAAGPHDPNRSAALAAELHHLLGTGEAA